MSVKLLGRCDGPTFAPMAFIGLHGFHMRFSMYCIENIEAHGPGAMLRTWVGHMHANSKKFFFIKPKAEKLMALQCRSAHTIHAIKS